VSNLKQKSVKAQDFFYYNPVLVYINIIEKLELLPVRRNVWLKCTSVLFQK